MDALETYSQEIGLPKVMTLDKLIESHRHLRSLNLECGEQRLKALDEAREQGHAEGLAKATAKGGDFIAIERLRAMTLAEIATLIIKTGSN